MQNPIDASFSIKSWAAADRPREKLMEKGKENLTDAELLAIVLGSGSRQESAVDLAKRMLQSAGNNLDTFSQFTLKELMTFKGIGEAKAVSIAAVMELGRRRQVTDVKEKPKVHSSKDAYNNIGPLLNDLPHEEFWILLLNRANRILSRQMVSKGGVSGTVVDAKIVFRKALDGNASSLILCHNHPSGNLNPSQIDIKLTEKLIKAGENIDIPIVDHLIIANRTYYSMRDEGVCFK